MSRYSIALQRKVVVPLAALRIGTLLSGCQGWFSQLTAAEGSSLAAVSCACSSTCVAVGSTASGKALVEPPMMLAVRGNSLRSAVRRLFLMPFRVLMPKTV